MTTASSSKVSNSVTWVNLPDGKYECIWNGFYAAVPLCGDENILFEVDGENLTGINTGIATVYGKMARVNRNNTTQDKKANYYGTIDCNKVVVFDKTTKEMVQ